MKSSELVKLIRDYEEMFGEFNIDNSFDIDKLKEDIKYNKTKKLIPFKDGDKLYYIELDGNVLNRDYYGDSVDINSFMLGNVFKTREEAEFEIERRKIEAKLLSLGGTRDGRENITEMNYVLYCTPQGKLDIGMVYGKFLHQGNIYFKDRNILKNVIKIIGEKRIKKYLFYIDGEDKGDN